MDSKQKEQQQWHELYEKWSWVASQFFDEAVKDFNDVKDHNDKGRAHFSLPQKIEEHLWRVWRVALAYRFSEVKLSKLAEKGKNVRPPVERYFMFALQKEIDKLLGGSFSLEQVLKDSDKKDELKRNWHDFFYWGYDKRFVESLSKVSKVLDREEVENSLDVLLWQGWDRAEVERSYLHAVTKEFSKDLIRLRYDVFGEEDLPIDEIYDDDGFFRKKHVYDGEKRVIRLLLGRWFRDALKEFRKGKKSWILSVSPTANRDLKDVLSDLWMTNFQIFF